MFRHDGRPSRGVCAHAQCLRSEQCTCADVLLLNKSLLDGSALQCQGPGSDNKLLVKS